MMQLRKEKFLPFPISRGWIIIQFEPGTLGQIFGVRTIFPEINRPKCQDQKYKPIITVILMVAVVISIIIIFTFTFSILLI